MGGLAVLRNYAAVDGACFLVRRELFEDLGGFDESLGWHFQDADFCLRAAERGWRTVFTPYCRAIHEEEATGLRPVRPAEAALMRERWGAVLDDDPFYHPAFTRRWENFTIDWPERMPRRG
jgi:GT2 family glycosyltransferase